MPRGIAILAGWIAAFVAALVALCAPAAAQSGLVGTPLAVCVAPVRAGDTPTRMLAAADRFDCATPQTSFGRGDYWVRSASVTIRNPANIRTASLWQDRSTLYVAYADGTLETRIIDGRGASRALQIGAIFEQPIHQRAAPAVRLLWRVEGAANLRGILVGPRIATPADSARANLTLGTLYGAFAGLCVALLVYNLALWVALRRRFQLAYCAMVACLLLYAISSSGASAWAWPDVPNNDRMRSNYMSLALAAAAALVFARSFFESFVFRGWLARANDAAIWLLIGTSTVFAFLAPWQIKLLDRLYAVSFLALVAVAFAILAQAWRRRSNFLWLFAIAWAAPIALSSLRVAGNFNLVSWSFLLDNSTIASMSLEALLSSVAIAYRIKLLTRERDEAREKEIAARLLADIDPLTGLLNRRAFLREAIGRDGAQLLIVADIDHFKRVNDTLGHDGGDEVLRVVARALRMAVPPGALVARIGGEEFAIVVPDGAGLAPAAILDRVRAERMPFDLTVTVSLGTCVGPLDTETNWNAMYRAADQALFAAKAAGRDRVRHGDRRMIAA
jgi:diguanylate cyclase (GGDEF)-like protein